MPPLFLQATRALSLFLSLSLSQSLSFSLSLSISVSLSVTCRVKTVIPLWWYAATGFFLPLFWSRYMSPCFCSRRALSLSLSLYLSLSLSFSVSLYLFLSLSICVYCLSRHHCTTVRVRRDKLSSPLFWSPRIPSFCSRRARALSFSLSLSLSF